MFSMNMAYFRYGHICHIRGQKIRGLLTSNNTMCSIMSLDTQQMKGDTKSNPLRVNTLQIRIHSTVLILSKGISYQNNYSCYPTQQNLTTKIIRRHSIPYPSPHPMLQLVGKPFPIFREVRD